MGPSQQETTAYTYKVMQTLTDAGFIMSEKSRPEADSNQDYIGKNYSSGRIANTTKRLSALLALFMAVITMPTLSPILLEKLQGVSVYACCHTSSYATLALLRMMTRLQNYAAPTYQLQHSLAATMAVAMCPWEMQGFFALKMPDSPLVYVDAGPQWVGIVFFYNGYWQQVSFHHPSYVMNIPIQQRQQSAELYGVYAACNFCLKLNIQEPTFVLDSSSAYFTVIKGSTTLRFPRTKILMKIQHLVQRHRFRAYVNMINTRFHPGDIPSRLPTEQKAVSAAVKQRLDYIRTRPSLITVEPLAYNPDTSRDAWSTPQWMRKIILKSPRPPTWDLFADQTNALTCHFNSLENPFTPAVFNRSAVFFFQPPYKLLLETWQETWEALLESSSLQLWGLVPKGFYRNVISPMNQSLHCCSVTTQLDYIHPTVTDQPGSMFESVLFFFSKSSYCVCHYLQAVFPDCA